ncbi:MAG TPA: hypothetical protein VFX28_24535 [Methylomirabilota bacterium]|nr:hypothetical protein [Methylomirabilota bacterium]
MIDLQTEMAVRRLERERQLRGAALIAEANSLTAARRPLRARLATGLARLALAMHNEAATGAGLHRQADTAG